MFPSADWQWFPLSNPGIISIPMGFILGYQEGPGLTPRRRA